MIDEGIGPGLVLLKAPPPRLALKDVLDIGCLFLGGPLTRDEIKAILLERKSNCELFSLLFNFVLSPYEFTLRIVKNLLIDAVRVSSSIGYVFW
jgi:hypothetical protein